MPRLGGNAGRACVWCGRGRSVGRRGRCWMGGRVQGVCGPASDWAGWLTRSLLAGRVQCSTLWCPLRGSVRAISKSACCSIDLHRQQSESTRHVLRRTTHTHIQMGSAPRKQSKTYKVPKRPYEAARLDAELKVGVALGLCWSWSDGQARSRMGKTVGGAGWTLEKTDGRGRGRRQVLKDFDDGSRWTRGR